MSRELDEIRLLNKKHHQQEQQRKEEEEKRKKDEEATRVLADGVVTTVDVLEEDEDVLNFTADVHNIMNGFEEMETEEHEKDDKDERSPMKKRPGSSKASSRRSRTAVRQVSPPDSGVAPILKPALHTPSIVKTINHTYKRTIFELAILLTSQKKFEEFTNALIAFLTIAPDPCHPSHFHHDLTAL